MSYNNTKNTFEMKVFSIFPNLSYAGGCILVVAATEERAWDLATESRCFDYESKSNFSIMEVKGLSGDEEGVKYENYYIE